jgi:hypothetical protein
MLYFYYYVRDALKRPTVTYCIVFNGNSTENIYSRGLAICSKKDNPCKKIGRAIATGRALKSLKTGTDQYDKSKKICTAQYMPGLTKHERHIIKNSIRKHK